MEMYQHENFFARKQSIKQAEREKKSRAEVFDKDNIDLREKIAQLQKENEELEHNQM